MQDPLARSAILAAGRALAALGDGAHQPRTRYPGSLSMPLALSPLQSGQVPLNRNWSRAMMRSAGLKFHEMDIESGSPKEFQRKTARVVADMGFEIVDDKMNASVDAMGVGVGDVAGEIIAHRDERIDGAITWSVRPYTVVGVVLTVVFVMMAGGLASCFGMGAFVDDSGFSAFMFLICGVGVVVSFLPLCLALITRVHSEPVIVSTVLRVRTEGEAYSSRSDEEAAAGRRMQRAQVTARLSVAMTTEVQGAFDVHRVPGDLANALRRDAEHALTRDAFQRFERAKLRSVSELSELADRIAKFSQVA